MPFNLWIMPMADLTAYAGLFLAALLAATVVPMQSEAVLVGLLISGDYPPVALLTVASAGNILGAVLNWFLGVGLERFRRKSWFPVSDQRMNQAQGWYHRYGRWSLLLCWLPVVGDPLTVAAGVMREPFWSFVFIAGSAKLARYLVLTGLTLRWLA